jgi:dGTPase
MTNSPVQRDQRKYDSETGDTRSEFERDRDRLLHSLALRRLAGVTQVVSPFEGHIFHNRLTHSLKVAQIARGIAENLLSEKHKNRKQNQELIEAAGGLDPNVVEAAALAHDLGHPPFGHLGEVVLNDLVREHGNADGFEGNAQSLRIISQLEVRRLVNLIPQRGLNLTCASLNAVLKYPWTYGKGKVNLSEKKWGAYSSENDVLEFARQLCNDAEDTRMSLEASIMDWADDIAYATHDVEDFYRIGLIQLDRLVVDASITPRGDAFIASGTEAYRFLSQVAEWRPDKTFRELCLIFKSLMELIPLTEPYQGSRRQQAQLRAMSTRLIHQYIEDTAINPNAVSSDKLIRLSEPYIKIGETDRQLIEIKILKDLTRYYVHQNRPLRTQQFGEERIIRELFIYYFDATGDKSDGILPPDAAELLKEERAINGDKYASDEALRARIVADMIARMTDDEAISMRQRLLGVNPGSINDRWFSGQ